MAMTTPAFALLSLATIFWLAGCGNYVPGDSAYNLGHPEAARELYETKYKMGSQAAGLRLAEMLLIGSGGASDPARAIAIYRLLATKGAAAAEHDLGYCYEYGLGVAVDYQNAAVWYRKAADHGYVPALYNLGTLYAADHLIPKNDVEGLTLLLEAAELTASENTDKARFIHEDPPGHRQRLVARMSPNEISVARQDAQERVKQFRRIKQPAKSEPTSQP